MSISDWLEPSPAMPVDGDEDDLRVPPIEQRLLAAETLSAQQGAEVDRADADG